MGRGSTWYHHVDALGFGLWAYHCQGLLSSSPSTMPNPRTTSLAISSVTPSSDLDEMSGLIILECSLATPKLPYSLKTVRHVTLEGAHFLLEYRDGYHAVRRLGSDIREAFLFGVLTHYIIHFYAEPIWPLPVGQDVSPYRELERVCATMRHSSTSIAYIGT
jgi:hypothetical protein